MIPELTASAFLSLPPERTDPAMEARVFSSIKLRNGSFKTTSTGRFADLDGVLERFLSPRRGRIRQVLDAGASTGCTTIDLARLFARLGIEAEITAADACIDAFLVELTPGFRVLADGTGWPLQYEVRGRPMRPWPRRLDWIWLAAPARLIARSAAAAAVSRKLRRGEGRPLQLASPRLRDFPNIRLLEHNLLAAAPDLERRFDFVRAANVASVAVLGRQGLATVAENLLRMLSGPGALLLVLRTAPRTGVHSGTVFEMDRDGSLGPALRFGGGSEAEAAFLQAWRGTDPRPRAGWVAAEGRDHVRGALGGYR